MSRSEFEALKKPDVVKCRDCNGTYFEQIQVNRYPESHNVIIGQRVQPSGDTPFYVFRCVRCGGITEPRVTTGPRDAAAKNYDEFLDEMEKMPDTKPELL